MLFLPCVNLNVFSTAVFAEVGIDISKPTIMSCGSGVTACALAFAAYTAGQEQVPVFDVSVYMSYAHHVVYA